MLAVLLRYVLLVLVILLGVSELAGGAVMVVIGIVSKVVAFGVSRRLSWAWAAALIQGILLVLWIGLQIALGGVPMPVHWLYLTWGAAIIALCLIPAVRAEVHKPPQAVLRRQPEIAELEAQFTTKETDPERVRNRQLSNTYLSGRG